MKGMNMSQNGKGSKPRPKSIDYKTWSNNWDKIFHTKKKVRSGHKK